MRYLAHNIWIIVSAGLLFGLLFPALGILFLSPILKPMFMVLMFFSVIDIKIKDVMRDIQRPGKTITTLLIIHLVSPIIILALQSLWPPEIFLGLIISAAVSSGVSVVFLTQIFGGEPSRSLVITTLSNLLAPITIPLLVLFFARTNISVDPLSMAGTITQIIILPFIVAQFVSQTKWKKTAKKYSTEGSLLLLFLIIIGTIAPVRDTLFDNLLLTLELLAFVSVLVTINFLLGFTVGRAKESKISFGVSSSFKNFVLATVISLSLYNPLVALPAIIYSVVNSFMLIPMQWFIEGQTAERHDVESE